MIGKWGRMHSTALLLVMAMTEAVNAELYSAIVDLEKLVETEAVLIRALDEYISSTEHRLIQLKRHAAEYSKKYAEASVDVSAYLSNPINAYLLVKRLTIDWKQTESLMLDFAQEVRQNMTQYREMLKFPSQKDLNGAAEGLMRLQDIYQLDTASVARGQLNGVQYSTQLSADDCFELGRQSYNNKDFYHTVLWMTESLKRHEMERKRTNIERWEILEYLAYSIYIQGNVRSALQMTDELLTIVPTHQRALGNRTLYQAEIEKAPGSNKPQMTPPVDDDIPEREVYHMLCRNALSPSPQVLSQLKCRYVHKNEPFLRIAPLKEEEAYLKPRILLYRDVIYDGEIETIKKIALPKLKRATVEAISSAEKVTNYRTCKSAWLAHGEHPVVDRLSRRVEHFTGLNMAAAEDLQVVNYGIGGHYDTHHDFFQFTDDPLGNRIATVLFYMSDVAQGGATVFPLLNLALWPEKGTAAFWYNLHTSGDTDFTTLHAACPVLVGSKWVSNRWIHERGQEFRRPCSLEQEVLF